MAGRDVKLAVMPTRALRLACGTKIIAFRIAVKPGTSFPSGVRIGHPSAADRDEPEVAVVIEGAALKKLALRLVVDISEQRYRPDTRRRGRKTPRLHLFG